MTLILLSIPAAARAYMFGRWLKTQGNRTGGNAVYLIAVICVVLPVYRYLTGA